MRIRREIRKVLITGFIGPLYKNFNTKIAIQIPLNPPLSKGDFNSPLRKRGAGGDFMLRGRPPGHEGLINNREGDPGNLSRMKSVGSIGSF
jgi:hypothetical protein